MHSSEGLHITGGRNHSLTILPAFLRNPPGSMQRSQECTHIKMPCGTKGLVNPIFGLVGTTGGPQAVGWLVVGAGGRRQVERSLTCDLGRGWRTGTLTGHLPSFKLSLSSNNLVGDNAFEICTI